MTIRLYDQDTDILEFTATVLGCEKVKEGWEVTLDQTAFFPEGGGQGADHGTIAHVHVLDAHDHGDVIHLTDGPLEPGMQVTCHVDGARRRDMMQQHTGEHIYSGIVHKLYGYDNVGFHIGSDAVRLDFNGMLSLEEARHIEHLANEAVFANLPVEILYPENPGDLTFRSKKEIKEKLRILRIPGIDTCACCGTHVKTTGSVGQIKVISVMKYKSGVRIFILCGMRALAYENTMLDQVHMAGNALSAKLEEVGDAVTRLLHDREQVRYERDGLSMQIFELKRQAELAKEIRVVTCPMPGAQMRKAAGKLAENARLGMVLTPGKDGGWNFALSGTVDVRPVTKALCGMFRGKGGGVADMTQGTLGTGTEEEIRSFLVQEANK